MNLTLHAVARATLHLSTGDVPYTREKRAPLWQTPTDATRAILALPPEERLAAYKEWALLRGTGKFCVTVWEEGDPTVTVTVNDDLEQVVVGDTVRQVEMTTGEQHVQDLERWLKKHEGWTFEWGQS